MFGMNLRPSPSRFCRLRGGADVGCEVMAGNVEGPFKEIPCGHIGEVGSGIVIGGLVWVGNEAVH